jgi:hypothetical protein
MDPNHTFASAHRPTARWKERGNRPLRRPPALLGVVLVIVLVMEVRIPPSELHAATFILSSSGRLDVVAMPPGTGRAV